MIEPYTPGMISRVLKRLPDARIASIRPHDFHLHPVAKHIVSSAIIRELIANERNNRRAV